MGDCMVDRDSLRAAIVERTERLDPESVDVASVYRRVSRRAELPNRGGNGQKKCEAVESLK